MEKACPPPLPTCSLCHDYAEAGIFKRVWGPVIDSKEWIPPAYVAWRAGTITLFLAPIAALKIPALDIGIIGYEPDYGFMEHPWPIGPSPTNENK